MHLNYVTVRGGLGISQEQRIAITELNQINVFVGPNNTGKSITARLLSICKYAIENEQFDAHFSYDLSKAQIDSSLWWNWNQDWPIRIVMSMTREGLDREYSTKPIPLTNDDVFTVEFCILLVKGKPKLSICPWVNLGSELRPLLARQHGVQIQFLETNGKMGPAYHVVHEAYILDGKEIDKHSLFGDYHQACRLLLLEWASETKFFAATLTLKTSSDELEMESGAQLAKELLLFSKDTEKAKAFADYRKEVVRSLNYLMGSSATPILDTVEVRVENDQPLILLVFNGVPIKLKNVGSGIARLFILCSYLVLDSIKPRLPDDPAAMCYFLEEPETHLHPAMLKRFGQYLASHSSSQFLITTHSNELLNGLSKSNVYLFSNSPNTGCSVEQCTKIRELHQVLDSLGVTGSSLLQANCILWVEGPSDRLYLNWWLDTSSTALMSPVVEGSDYAFAFYGGSNLAHFDFDEESTENLIQLLSINRYGAVVMDRDQARDENVEKLAARKQRIMSAADEVRKYAFLSDSWEIENDLPEDCFLEAAEKVLGLAKGDLKSAKLIGKSPYEKEICDYLGLKNEERTKAEKKLTNKVRMASLVISIAGEKKAKIQSPSYIPKILDVIKKARGQ